MLGPYEHADCPHFSTVYGHFPPELRFNQDQVPLPFVLSMDSTYTLTEDTDVHVSFPNDALRKRQFIMHIIANTGEGENKLGYTTLVCKGSSRGRCKQYEVAEWDPELPCFGRKMHG